MKKLIFILFIVLCINNAFGYEDYYNRLKQNDKILLDSNIKRCVSFVINGAEKVDDEMVEKARILCEDWVACVYDNFGIEAVMEWETKQVRYCFEKLK